MDVLRRLLSGPAFKTAVLGGIWVSTLQTVVLGIHIASRYEGDADAGHYDVFIYVYAEMGPLLPMIIASSAVLTFIVVRILMDRKGDLLSPESLKETTPIKT